MRQMFGTVSPSIMCCVQTRSRLLFLVDNAGSSPRTSEEPKYKSFRDLILALWPHQHFVCGFPHGLLSCLWGLTSKSGHAGCLMWRNPYGWLKKLSNTRALLPQPARSVCREEAGLWKGEDSKPLISVNFVPWLPGSASFEIRQTLQ